MTVEKFISTKKLDGYVRGEVAELLRAKGVHDLNHYGWLDGDTPNPEFAGLALGPPLGWDLAFANSFMGKPLSEFPPLQSWQQFPSVSYNDFEGLTEAGLACLLVSPCFMAGFLKDDPFADESFFRLHWMGSIFSLSTASDRIRDVLVAAVFQRTAKEYADDVSCGSKRRRYTAPFLEAVNRFPGLSSISVPLAKTAEEIVPLRQSRNQIVHEIASRFGSSEQRRLNEASHPQQIMRSKFSPGANRDLFAIHRARNAEKIESELEMLVKWYLTSS